LSFTTSATVISGYFSLKIACSLRRDRARLALEGPMQHFALATDHPRQHFTAGATCVR
jgi:hypothetical protein